MKTESARGLDGLDEQIVLAEQRRQRVFRRWWLGVVICLMALVALRLGWGLYAGRQLAAEIERIRAAGEPIYPSDFNPAYEIPDAENAAVLYREAAAAIVEPDGLSIEFDDLLHPSSNYQQRNLDDIRLVVAENVKALRLFREARALTAVDWGVRFKSPIFGGSLGFYMEDLRQLMGIGELAVLASHREGNDRKAFETIRDMTALAHAAIRPMTTNTGDHEFAARTFVRLARVIELISSEIIMVDEGQALGRSRTGASRVQVKSLIDELLDESRIRDGWRKAVFVERAMWFDERSDHARELVDGGGSSALLYGITAPAWDAQLPPLLTAIRRQATAAWAGNWSRARQSAIDPFWRMHETFLDGVTELYSRSKPLAFFGMPFLHTLRFYSLARRRMAAITLSIRLFELDHNRRPSELSELVPRYLKALPHAPFALEEHAFRYKPNGVVPMLYSYGRNEQDDGAKIGIREDGSFDLFGMDLPFFLNGRPDDQTLAAISARPKSPQAQNKNGD